MDRKQLTMSHAFKYMSLHSETEKEFYTERSKIPHTDNNKHFMTFSNHSCPFVVLCITQSFRVVDI